MCPTSSKNENSSDQASEVNSDSLSLPKGDGDESNVPTNSDPHNPNDPDYQKNRPYASK